MSDRIVIDLGFVLDLKADVSMTTTRLRRDSDAVASISSRPEVDGALRSFMSGWDERRDGLASSLDALESALQAIHDSFTATEDELVAELDG